MAKSLRIDSVTESSGQVTVNYTYGETPLDTTPSGRSITWPNRQAVRDALLALTDQLSEEQLILMRLVQHVKQTGDNTLTNRAAMGNKTITVDFSVSGTLPIDMR